MKFTDLAPYTNRLDLLNLTVEQIKKDFNLFGAEISFSGRTESAYLELFQQIKPYIESLLNHNYEKLLTLLYRIDVTEKSISNIVLNAGDEMVNEMTDLIIKRELQKVVIREYYKQTENNNQSNELSD